MAAPILHQIPIPMQTEAQLLDTLGWIDVQPNPHMYAERRQQVHEVLRAVRTLCRYCSTGWPSKRDGWTYLKIDERWTIVHSCQGTDYIARPLKEWELVER